MKHSPMMTAVVSMFLLCMLVISSVLPDAVLQSAVSGFSGEHPLIVNIISGILSAAAARLGDTESDPCTEARRADSVCDCPSSSSRVRYRTVTAKPGAVMRSGPSGFCRGIGMIPCRTAVPVYRRNGNWIRTSYHGTVGWVRCGNLSCPPCQERPRMPRLSRFPGMIGNRSGCSAYQY